MAPDSLDVKITVDGKASNITYQSAEEYGENEKGFGRATGTAH